MDLKRGYTFIFQNSTWKVTESHTITWDQDAKSKVFKIKSHRGIVRFLEFYIITDEEPVYSIWTKEFDKDFIRKAQDSNTNYIKIGNAKFPKTIRLKGIEYTYANKYSGNCRYGVVNLYQKEKVDAIDYKNQNEAKLLSIQVWDDEIEVSTGFRIHKNDIRSIAKGTPPISSTMITNIFNQFTGFILIFGFVILSSVMRNCENRNSWNSDDSQYQNDSTKVKRSNSSYRGRNSYGYGK